MAIYNQQRESRTPSLSLCLSVYTQRLSLSHSKLVSKLRLMMLLDSDISPNLSIPPENFVARLRDNTQALRELLANALTVTSNQSMLVFPSESTISAVINGTSSSYDKSNRDLNSDSQSSSSSSQQAPNSKADCEEEQAKKNVAIWKCRSSSLVYCVGKPKHFSISDQCYPYFGAVSKQGNQFQT